jgi:hypothetical protein
MLALGGQCSNPTAVEQQLGAMFGVLGGSQGKVGLAPAMASHLQAAGGLATSAMLAAGAAVLAASATGHFVTFLCRQLVVEPAALLARPQTGSPGGQAGRRSGAGRAPWVLLPCLLERTGQLASPALLAVTVRDLRIALTPPGEL